MIIMNYIEYMWINRKHRQTLFLDGATGSLLPTASHETWPHRTLYWLGSCLMPGRMPGSGSGSHQIMAANSLEFVRGEHW